MKVTYKDIPGTDYSESPQNNPIRWILLAKVGEDEYESTTQPFKCKDYFNDFVIYKQLGKEFRVHGMRSQQAKFCERSGLYVLVYNTTPEFVQNVKNVLQVTFKDAWDASVEVTPIDKSDINGLLQKDNFAILWFSPECLVSTFRISVLTFLIRNCNVPFVVNTYDERIDQNLCIDGDLPYAAYMCLRDKNFTFPEQAEYVWYIGEEYNSQGTPTSVYSMHDNGLRSWVDACIGDEGGGYNWLSKLPTLGATPEPEEEEYDWDEEEEDAL